MEILDAIILGIVQGLTEFLPVSSDGHLMVTTELLGAKDNLVFMILLHVGTVCASLIVFRKDILNLLKGILKFQWNEETRFAAMIIVSMLPVMVVGLFFKDQVDAIFKGSVVTGGIGFLVTAFLLFATALIRKTEGRDMNFFTAIMVGIAQAIAVLPGVSRSGSTISTGLLLGIDRAKMARFSFLMVIIPILGEAILDAKDVMEDSSVLDGITSGPIIAGFIASFLVGLAACSAMIAIVKRGKIHWFGIYCVIAGILTILWGKGLLWSVPAAV